MVTSGSAAGILTRLLIVEANELQRLGFCTWFEQHPQFEVVAATQTAAEALTVVQQYRVDVAIVDLDLPQRQGLSLMQSLNQFDNLCVLSLTATPTDSLANISIGLGAVGFVSKYTSLERLAEIVAWVRNGRGWIDPSVAKSFVKRIRCIDSVELGSEDSDLTLPQLTGRELEVLGLIAQGYSNVGIGNTLHIAPSTVKTHICRILEKLEVSDRTQAAVKAARLKLLAG